MLKLYGGAQSRAAIARWYLEELQVPYEFVQLDMRAGAHRQPDFLAINPFGKVPAIVDGDCQLWESGAILLYLAEKQGQLPESICDRAKLTQWVLFANATLGPGIFNSASREQEMPKLLTPLNQLLKEQPFIMGTDFTVADVAVGSILAFLPMMLGINYNDYPAVNQYIKRLSERPAYKKGLRGA
jgi:glutathione S-transferase